MWQWLERYRFWITFIGAACTGVVAILDFVEKLRSEP